MGCVQGKGGRVLSTHPRPSSPSCLPSLPPPPSLSQVELQAQQVGVAEAPSPPCPLTPLPSSPR